MSGRSHPDKRELRALLKRELEAIEPERRRALSAAICERVVASDAYRRAETMLAFWPLASEPDVLGVVDAARASGRRLALPSASWEDGGMVARSWDGERASLIETRFGIFEPPPDGETIEDVDLVLVPGLGFDESGGRLGRGGGFYDRFLGSLGDQTTPLGVAYEEQIIGRIPMEPHDARVRAIATERRLIEPA